MDKSHTPQGLPYEPSAPDHQARQALIEPLRSRAQRLLHGLPSEQISVICSEIDMSIHDLTEERWEDPDTADQYEGYRDIDWLHELLDFRGIADVISVRGVEDYQACAAFALKKVEQASAALSTEPGSLNTMECLVEATEAVVFSESIQAQKSLCAAWDSSIRLTDKKDQALAIQQAKQAEARKAARQRHLRAYEAQLEAVEIYASRKFPSYDAAAAHIAPQVYMTPRVVAKWLSAYSKDPTGFVATVKAKMKGI
jgi:hypothetical protein